MSLKKFLVEMKNSIKLIQTKEVFDNPKEWGKHAEILNNGEEQLKKEYSKRIKKIEQLNKELLDIQEFADEYDFEIYEN